MLLTAFVITYGVIAASILTLVLVGRTQVPIFQQWLSYSPLNIFWIAWITLVVASGGMIAMMIFPGADGQSGWGLLKFDGAFTGAEWRLANEINTQVLVLCFTTAALINHPPAITELYLTLKHPGEVAGFFPRNLSLRDRTITLVLANLNSIFMYPLTFSTWMLEMDVRPVWYTVVFLPLSFGCGIAAGVFAACRGTRDRGKATQGTDP